MAVWAALVGVVLGTGLAVAEGGRLRFSDERAYLSIAGNLAERGTYASDEYPSLAASLAGRPYDDRGADPATAYRPPAYPVLLGGLRVAGAGPVAMRVAGA